MNIILLTHERELDKTSNTGQLAVAHLSKQVSRVLWSRTQAEPSLLKLLKTQPCALVLPASAATKAPHENPALSTIEGIHSFIIVDSTWQEARKIYNHSAYLHALPVFELQPDTPSRFRLRRNQRAQGLCTAEVVAALLRQHKQDADAARIERALEQMQARWLQGAKL